MREQLFKNQFIYALSRLIIFLRVVNLVITKELRDEICKSFEGLESNICRLRLYFFYNCWQQSIHNIFEFYRRSFEFFAIVSKIINKHVLNSSIDLFPGSSSQLSNKYPSTWIKFCLQIFDLKLLELIIS